MSIRMHARTTRARVGWTAGMLLVATAARADVAARSTTGNTEEDNDQGKDSADAMTSSGEAHATSQPALSAVTSKVGDQSSLQNGATASFRDTARIVDGHGAPVRLSFGVAGMVTCASEPGRANFSSARVGGGIVGRDSTTCEARCSDGMPVALNGCGGMALQGRIVNVSVKPDDTPAIPLSPDDLNAVLPGGFPKKIGPGDLKLLRLRAIQIADLINARGFNNGNIKIPAGTRVKVGFDAQFFTLLPTFTVPVPPSGAALIASVGAVVAAQNASFSRGEIKGMGSRSVGQSLAAAASLPGYAVLSATTRGPVPAGMKIVFENSQTEVAVREETACSDGIDNDGDGAADFPADRGCESPFSASENPATPPLDGDEDLIFDSADNCPAVFNPLQEDERGATPGSPPDGIGDACQ